MKWKTKSARAWDDWLRETGTTREVAAQKLGITRDTVTKLRSTSRPGWDLAERMRVYTNGMVTIDGWVQPYVQPYIPPTPTSATATEPEGANP